MFDNIWDPVFNREEDPKNVLEVLQEICDSLRKKSDGIITAKINELQYVQIKSDLSKALGQFAQTGKYVASDDDKYEDAGQLYEPSYYGFDIISGNYKYRPFRMKLCASYPIFIYIDETIANEFLKESSNNLSRFHFKSGSNKMIVDNLNDFEDCITIILQSGKVTYILRELIKIERKKDNS